MTDAQKIYWDGDEVESKANKSGNYSFTKVLTEGKLKEIPKHQ